MRRTHACLVLFSVLPASLAAQERDLNNLDACKILAPADVANATKRKVASSVGGGMACTYVVEAPNSGADTYHFYLTKAATIEALLKTMSASEKGTPVSGIWTEAYVGPSAGSADVLSLIALNRGDLAIEIKGPNKDILIALAKLATSRLK